ncbi:MAG: hypothetical protein K0R89_2014 [Ramlibacter sp.]|jgi:uncharacterized NAD(P)/FAD-binding protein YdhS|nr:hypothetical protein [Ramlibacter sp.]
MNNRIAVVGAGFSGVAVAVQLLKTLRSPTTVTLLNRNTRFARGMAYGTRSASHLLNVPAGRMGIDAADEGGFLRFLQEQGIAASGSDFVPRKFFGDYLEHELERAQHEARPGVTLKLVSTQVTRLEETADGVRLACDDGWTLDASDVVLAFGNFPPQPPTAHGIWNTPLGVNDPWAPQALGNIPRDARVLLVGTGLTAVDVLLTLADRGHTGPITLLSRRGKLPQPHRLQHAPPLTRPVVVPPGRISLLQLVRLVRSGIREAARAGCDWRDVIAGLRADTPSIWERLDDAGRRQFLRHLQPFWDTHRHRTAPQTDVRLRELFASPQVSVVAARIGALTPRDATVEAAWRPRGARNVVHAEFDRVINCTGPSMDLRRVEDDLIDGLRSQHAVRVDTLGLGLTVGEGYRLQRADGSPHEHVRYVGPLLKAQWWEATAVPELRMHAAALAQSLVRDRAG